MIGDSKESNTMRRRVKKYVKNACSVKTLKKRLPIIQWLPKYSFAFLIQDLIAGITVGLTAIPQGIAYAVIAGLSPEYGLYASLTSGFVYVVFGSCKNVTVGPTAILAAMVAKYVSDYTPDFAILAAFLSGVVQFLLGILHLGFLVEFISQPVISGFTTAAALQIAAAQLKSFFGTAGSSGNYFAESVYYFFKNITTAKLWDPILSSATVLMLILLQKMGHGCKRTDEFVKSMRWFISLARNAVAVVVGMVIAYILKVTTDSEPLALIGDIGKGLPDIKPPPFGTVTGNETMSFVDMLQILGPQSLILPFVGILESISIAKAFAEGIPVDATQELIALGLCNIIGSFAGSMPITGSFTRTAINYASGVQTPAGGISKCLLLIFALSVMATTFYFIPKASLAGLILVAMYHLIDFAIFYRLWKTSKKELLSLLITLIVCLFYGLEYGIVVGVLFEAFLVMYTSARPSVKVDSWTCESGNVTVLTLFDTVSYCAAEHIRRVSTKTFESNPGPFIVNGTYLRHIDTSVAWNLMSVVKENKGCKEVFLLNMNEDVKKVLLSIDRDCDKFVNAQNVMDLMGTVNKSV